jgi:alkanesulfonate monooxygenase SsuD/methylene tetrahydromethanopterin reductase-like flavin-dependent oxidoreductase (luciferase family)
VTGRADAGDLLLELALDGVGAHPAAATTAGPDALRRVLDPATWVGLVSTAEAAGFDLVGLGDRFGPHDSTPRLDAVLVASRVAPTTRRVGLLPTATATHTEPFHHAKAIATLDHVSLGRAGVRVRTAPGVDELRLFGRRDAPAAGTLDADDLRDEADEWVDVVRRLWDSWEDGAEIRDTATGRFVDRDRLHPVDFVGRWFSVKGPLITPRPPQGQPLVAVEVETPEHLALAAARADLVSVAVQEDETVDAALEGVATAEHAAGRVGRPLLVLLDVEVTLAPTDAEALDRAAALDAAAPPRRDRPRLVGSPDTVADRLEAWGRSGADGFRIHPSTHHDDVPAVAADLLPLLRRRGLVGSSRPGTLRERLGLGRPASRYATEAP